MTIFLFQIQDLSGLGLLGGVGLAADTHALKEVLTVLVEVELVDDDLGGVDAERDGLARGLVAVDTLNVDDVLETVDRGDLALTSLVGAADDGDFVVLADRDRANLSIVRGESRALKIRQCSRCTSHAAPWRAGRS